MTRHFQKELIKIKKMILSLGATVEERVQMAKSAIDDRDAQLARRIIKLDFEIDEMEVEVEEAFCLTDTSIMFQSVIWRNPTLVKS